MGVSCLQVTQMSLGEWAFEQAVRDTVARERLEEVAAAPKDRGKVYAESLTAHLAQIAHMES